MKKKKKQLRPKTNPKKGNINAMGDEKLTWQEWEDRAEILSLTRGWGWRKS